MGTKFYVPAHAKPDKLRDTVSINDAVTYQIDFSAWQEDNSDITAVTWTLEAGQATLGSNSESAGVATALITFPYAGVCLFSVLADTGSQKKTAWLEIRVKDEDVLADDYGIADV